MTRAVDRIQVTVCRTADVPLGEGRPVTVAGRRVAVFHTKAGWYALDDACPPPGRTARRRHARADHCVARPLHDRRFDLATGAALTDGAPVSAHRVVLRGDRVLLELAGELRRAA